MVNLGSGCLVYRAGYLVRGPGAYPGSHQVVDPGSGCPGWRRAGYPVRGLVAYPGLHQVVHLGSGCLV